MELKVLAVGDVVAPAGLQYVCRQLRRLRTQHGVHFCVVNGENASCLGITPEQADRLFDAGADVITLGNHSFSQRSIVPYLEDSPYILRPANLPLAPGVGFGTFETAAGPAAVISLIGRCGMDYTPQNPFLEVDRLLKQLDTHLIFVDFHAEATSEKLAMGYYLDGRVSALWGTHTHVPTADEQVLPKGTGYVTDLGMSGPMHSVLGIRPELSIAKFRGELTRRYEPAPGPCKLEAVLFTVETEHGRCVRTERMVCHD